MEAEVIPTRTLAVLLVTLLIAGCARGEQARSRSYSPTVIPTQPDCSPYRHDSLKYIHLEMNVATADSESGLSRLARHGYEDAEGRAEADEEVRSRAGEMIRKLDALDREADAGKAKDRECFGKGTHGKKLAERYAQAKESRKPTRPLRTRP